MRKIAIIISGILFGLGLSISGVSKQEVVLSFLQLHDMGLLFVLGLGIIITALSYHLLPKMLHKPLLGQKFAKYPGYDKTVKGAILFGLGWGLSGVCPGTALATIGLGNMPIIYALAGIFLGAYAYGYSQSNKIQ